MVQMLTNIALQDTGQLVTGRRYVLASGLEVALVREGRAVFVDEPEAPPQVQAMAGPPARKRRSVEARA